MAQILIEKKIRRYSLYSVILIIILCMNGCSNDFLKDEPEYKGAFIEPLVINPQDLSIQTLTVNIPEVNNSYFQIMQYPRWMYFQQKSGYFSDGLATINLIVIKEEFDLYGHSGGMIVFSIKDFGLVSMDVTIRNPSIYNIFFNRDIYDFEADLSSLDFRIENQSTESVSWKITECPDWVKLDISAGRINAYATSYLNIKCDRTNQPQGHLSGLLKIEFDWGDYSVIKTVLLATEVVHHTNPSDLIEIEGAVADAVYCKETDRLFIATKNPNRLLVYNNDGLLISNIPLNKPPNCLSLTETGRHLYIGHSGLVSVFDSSMQQVSETYEVDFNVFDLVYGENGWLYMSPDAQYANEALIYLNITNRNILRSNSNNCYSRTNFRKIKSKPLLLCSREDISPAGVILVDISNGIPNQTEKYWHLDYGKQFWFSDDYKYTYGLSGHIFLTPDFNKVGDLLPLGRFDLPDNANWMDYCEQTKSLWVATNNWWGDGESYVSQYHSDNYNLIKSYIIEKYATTINGVLNSYKTIPYYIFSNKSGTHVFVIKNVSISFGENVNAWSMEVLGR